MKNKIKIIIASILGFLVLSTVVVYAMTPSDIEKLNKELEQNRGERKAYAIIIKDLNAQLEEYKSLKDKKSDRADEIKALMTGEEGL